MMTTAVAPSEQQEATALDVRWLQGALNQILGLQLQVDGIYGSQTRSAVRDYQGRSGLRQDGVAGPITVASLRQDLAQARQGNTITGSVACATINIPEVLDEFEFGRDRVRPRHQPQIIKIARCVVRAAAREIPSTAFASSDTPIPSATRRTTSVLDCAEPRRSSES